MSLTNGSGFGSGSTTLDMHLGNVTYENSYKLTINKENIGVTMRIVFIRMLSHNFVRVSASKRLFDIRG
jgi:hypothetical protein